MHARPAARLDSCKNRKFILGTEESEGEDGIRNWISLIRASGVDGTSKLLSPADCCSWLMVRDKSQLGWIGWQRRWCELRGPNLTAYDSSGDTRAGFWNLLDYTLYLPQPPQSHRPHELVLVPSMRDSSGSAFHCFAATNEDAYRLWTEKLAGGCTTVASPQLHRGLEAIVGGWGLSLLSSSSSQTPLQRELAIRLVPEDFDVMKMLGQGGFGSVMLVRRKESIFEKSVAGRDSAEAHHAAGGGQGLGGGGEFLAMKVMKKDEIIRQDQVRRGLSAPQWLPAHRPLPATAY